MKQKVIRSGNSLCVVVPSAFVKYVGVHAGDTVEVTCNDQNGSIEYSFNSVFQLPLNFQKKKLQ